MAIKKIMAIIFFIFLVTILTISAREQCPEYCSDSVHYIDGVYSERSGQCDYTIERCEIGCDGEGITCHISKTEVETRTVTNTSTLDTSEQATVTKVTAISPAQPRIVQGVETQAQIKEDPEQGPDPMSGEKSIKVHEEDGPDPMSESNPQPSPSPFDTTIAACRPPDCTQIEGFPNFPELSNIQKIRNKNSEAVFVESMLDVKQNFFNLLGSFIDQWPKRDNADFFGSEVLIESHKTELNAHFDKDEDQFTFYLPGEECDLVVDLCLNSHHETWSDIDSGVYLDTFKPYSYMDYNLNENPQCIEEYKPCRYKYWSTLGDNFDYYCEFDSNLPPSTPDIEFVGTPCYFKKGDKIGSYIKLFKNSEVHPFMVICGIENPMNGLPMCEGENNLNPTIENNPNNNCKSLKAENIEGGFHFLSLENAEFSYLRYTYACDEKGIFG